MYKAQKTIYGAIKGEITPGRPAIIHRNDQVPGLDWQTSPVVRIISMAIMGGRLGVKFETTTRCIPWCRTCSEPQKRAPQGALL